MSNIDMTITVTENLINKALDMYLRSIMSNLDNSNIKINYTAGRSPNGLTASVEISDNNTKVATQVAEPVKQTISTVCRVMPEKVLSTPKVSEPVEATVEPLAETVQPTVTEEPVQEVQPVKKSAFSISKVEEEEVQEDATEEPVVEATPRKKPRFNV